MKEDEFNQRVAQALTGCQLVEEELKLYITRALDLVRKRLGKRMPFKMSGEDYENSALETLIKIFGKLTHNNELVRDLRAFKDERNYLSHRGIVHCLDYEETYSEHLAKDLDKRLENIRVDAQRLRNAVHEEAAQFLGYLVFEDEES